MIVSAGNIQSLIPQRAPFVMIDELLYCDETIARTGLTVRADNIFVEKEKLREPGLVENIAQTAAARAGYIAQNENKPVAIGYIGAIKNLQVTGLPVIGDQLITEIKVIHQIFEVMIVSGTVTCNDIILAQCEMKIFITQTKN